MARQIGKELIDRMRHMNDSLESIKGGESDSPHPVEHTPAGSSTPGECTRQAGCTLTDAEREALHWFAHYGLPEHRAATLRGLLERANYPAVSDSSGGTRSKEPEES